MGSRTPPSPRWKSYRLDKIIVPERDDATPLPDLVKKALANRSDLLVEQSNVHAAEVSALGTINGLLPTAVPFVAFSNAGLAGTSQPLVTPFGTEYANPYVVGEHRQGARSVGSSTPRLSDGSCIGVYLPKPRFTTTRRRPITESTSCSSARRSSPPKRT